MKNRVPFVLRQTKRRARHRGSQMKHGLEQAEHETFLLHFSCTKKLAENELTKMTMIEKGCAF